MSERARLSGPPSRSHRQSIAPSAPGAILLDATEQPVSGIRRRGMAIVVAGGIVVLGVLYYFCFDPVFRHSATWTDPSDLWGTFRAAHYVGWGFLGGVYNQETGMVTFPGIAIVLAPVAMLSDALHMSSTIEAFRVAHPTAALLLVPTVLVLASTVVVAVDALADELGESAARRRRSLCRSG